MITAACCSRTTCRILVVDAAASHPCQIEVSIPTTTYSTAATTAAADTDLAGTLRLPNCRSDTTTGTTTTGDSTNGRPQGPLPGAVLFHGSGPQSRDSISTGQYEMVFGFEIPVFAQIANALQGAGFAVLTYDKRSCTPYNSMECANNSYPLPNMTDLSVDTFLDDAIAATAFLQDRPEVDPGRVAVIGHSQGGEFVPLVIQHQQQHYPAPSIMSAIMVATPFHSIEYVLESQLNYTLYAHGPMINWTEQELLAIPAIKALAVAVRQLKELIHNNQAGTTVTSDNTSTASSSSSSANNDTANNNVTIMGVPAAFWMSWIDLHARSLEAAAAMNHNNDDDMIPLLILNGALDTNVPPSEAHAWAEYLDRSGVDHYSLTILPCITHALNCIMMMNGERQESHQLSNITTSDVGRNVDPSVTNAMIDFLLLNDPAMMMREDFQSGDDGDDDEAYSLSSSSSATTTRARMHRLPLGGILLAFLFALKWLLFGVSR